MRFASTCVSRLVLLTLAVCSTPACSDKGGAESEGSETGSTGSTGSTGGTDVPTGDSTEGEDLACACIDPEKFGGESYVCEAGPCAPFEAICDLDSGGGSTGGGTDTDTGGDTEGDCVFIVDEAKLGCALDLLISGEDGVVRWSFTADGGFSGMGAFVQVRPDRQGLTRSWDYFDTAPNQSAAGVVPLKASDYFQGCKDMPVLEDRFYCMTMWSDQQPEAQCDAGGGPF